eukprot:m.10755 g.10755  ORF g.10755 m.10755 type:complete len:292 (+) comp22626_c0_seq1:118-993(+)
MQIMLRSVVVGVLLSLELVFSSDLQDLSTHWITEKIARPNATQVNYYNATICRHQQVIYRGYFTRVVFNLPFNLDWLVDDGVVYGVASSSPNFSNVLCANYKEGSVEALKECHFVYNSSLGPNLYFRVTASNSPAIEYTLGLEFFKESRSQNGLLQPRFLDMTIDQPKANTEFQPLTPIIRLAQSGFVETTKSIDYSFGVCSLANSRAGFLLEITVYGLTAYDALCTYVCNETPCTTENSIASDVSAASMNSVSLSSKGNFSEGVGYIHIVGYGGLGSSDFELGALIRALG